MLQDVVITKLFLPERRGNLLLTNIKQEPTSEGCPSQSLSAPVTEISEPTQSNSRIRFTRSQSVTCPPPYFTSSEHITLPGNTFYTWSRFCQQPISGTLSGHLNESNGLVVGSSVPAVTNVNDSTALIVPSTIRQRTPHDDQCSSSNVIHNTASADTRLHLATGGECVNSLPFGNDTLSGSSSGVTLPPTTQSSGPRTSDAFNHRPVHSAVRNRCTLVPRPTPLSKGCTQPETGVLLNSQPPMVNTCSQQLGSNIQNPVVSTVDPNRLSISSAANRINEQILNPPPPPPMDENVLWGRVTRNSSGDLKFPGINRTFKSVSSVLRQIYQTAKAEDSLSLQLPSSAIQCENEANIRLENSLPNSLLNSTSRKGLYICLCCRSTFTSSALYEDHLDRAVARILYRCHICRGSWTTSREAVSIADNHESETCSRFYSVLPGGIISANNKCAIFTHLVSAHPDKRSDWILRPSLLTICPLVMPTTFLNLAAQTASTTTDIQSFDVSNEQQAPTRLTSNQLVKTHLMNDLCKSRVWSDLQHSLSNISALGSLDFLQPSSSASSLCKQVSSNRVGRLTRTCNDIVVERFSSLKRIFTPSSNNSESNLPSLPCSDSVLYRLILNSATSEIWHSHLFLPEWCSDEIRTIGTPARTTATATATTKTVNRQDENNPVTIQTNNNNDDDNDDNVENGQTNYCDNSVNVGDSYSAMSRKVSDTCLPPSAPSNAHLNLALNAILSSYRSPQSSTPSSSSSGTTALVQSSDSINRRGDLENSDNTPIQATSKHVMVTSSSDQPPSSSLSQQQQQPFGVLRCLLCKFKTNDKQRLKMHLMGSGRTVVNTKCGLCGQLLSIEQPNLCLIKAHILLHLGCHIMCPQCGFTPPAHLSPDCAELCLRAHLRFVCYHFNLREIFQCCYCHESGGNKKGYKAFENLCQHYFECHTRRIYSCLLCVQHQKQLQSIEELTNHMRVIHGANTPPGAMNSSTSTVHPISGFVSESQTVLLPPSLVNMNGPPVVHGNGNYNSSVMSENADYSTRYQCIECLRVLDTREEYFRHFSAEHRSACIQENYYRCFVTPRGNNEINLVLQNQESVADNGSSSDCSQQLLQQQQQHQLQESPSNCETTPFTARYFTDLINLHNHERDSHFFDSRKLIACPWCHKQLTFSKKDNANVTYEHLLSHVHEHYMVSWCLARTRQWNENAKALPHCVCGLALLDSPLAILSHSGTHLIHADKYKSSCIVPPDPIQLRRLKRQHPSSSSSSSNNRQYSSEEFLFPKPNDHIPCCIEVYRHLRFGVSPQFDAHLLEATKGSLTFTCPICPTVLCTRWALTQHAFSEHWGTLCYICCIYTFNSDENSPSLDISTDDGNVQMPNACPSMSSLPTIASSSSSSLSPSSLMTTKKIASTSTTATPTPPTEIIVPHSMEISANLWDHIFQCMNQRRDLLNNSHHHQHGPFPSMSSLSMSSAPLSSSSLTKAGLRVNDVDNHHDQHPDQQQLFIREIDLDRSESELPRYSYNYDNGSDCHDPGENFNDFALTIVSSPEHEKMTNNDNNADKKCSDVGSSSTQIQDINETYLSSNISTDAISSTSVSTTTIPMTSNSSSLLSTAAPATAITTTTNTSVVVAASAPLPSCSSAIEYVHKIFDNKSLKRKATTTSESCGSTSHKRLSLSLNKGDCSNDNSVQGSCHRSIEGVGGVSAGGDDNDEYSSTNNSATTTPCIDWGAQEQQVSGGISRSWDDTNVTEMSVSDRPIIPSGAVSNSSVPVVIYKCYLCRNKKYPLRSSCLYHMTVAHGLGTSELDWNRMIETNDGIRRLSNMKSAETSFGQNNVNTLHQDFRL
uniref:C2H2-type domain-containing protein n=1 Tax=Trichobilharzia regenti TaxID=157069 RepID=A0AA85J6L3_TRIRE|nr:unnamed protein product [Trichobilharzia regenti]